MKLDIFDSLNAEVSKRCLEMDQGTVELRAAADVFAKAYASLE